MEKTLRQPKTNPQLLCNSFQFRQFGGLLPLLHAPFADGHLDFNWFRILIENVNIIAYLCCFFNVHLCYLVDLCGLAMAEWLQAAQRLHYLIVMLRAVMRCCGK